MRNRILAAFAALLLFPLAAHAATDLELTLDPAKPLAEVRDSTYQRGVVGVTSRFHPALFDNLQIVEPSR